ncbi:transcriptional regulator [Candidatus Desantisbacteria bacterium CG_4_10_14_0_8_um_filter_48_22]|uniref:Transcriptional regulator n=1 Tax=Candidatus Desantisbacteria bacterium CG_4_10_14_0_8_um_filter_48_22 TaxID=1974543 RepID=A0A2M7SD16_9BACT|nr:MAG: transcriptional regulator [Candidatus Desantisbacteria bacterium CG_4_10_14_0_8_um_filter_48_22]
MKDEARDLKVYQLHAELCGALAHPLRLQILNLLRGGEESVKELLMETGVSKANLSQHLTVLRKQKIISSRREGVNIFYRLTKPKMIRACDIIREVLFEQLAEGNEILRKYGR